MKLTYKIASSILCGLSLLMTITPVYADADDTSDLLKALKAERSQAHNDYNNSRNHEDDKNKIMIDIDYMEGFTLQKPAGQIVIGNPVIADITVRDDQYIFISGKSPGRTNMLVYGRDGNLQERYTIYVRDPNTYLTVYTGAENKLHYDCLPQCQRVLRIEDKGSDAESQRAKISSQLEMIDGRAQKAKAAEMTPENQ